MLFILAWLLWLYNNSNHGNANSNKQNNEEVKNNEKVITPNSNEDLEACFEDELEFKENVPLLSKEEKEDVKINLVQDEILEKTEKEDEIYFKFPANSSVGSSFSSENSLIRNSYIDNKSAGSSTDDIIQEYLLASSQSAVSDISTECLFIGANHQHHGNESCQYEGDADNLVNVNKGSKTSIQGDVDFGAAGDQQEVPENLIEKSSINPDHSQPEDSLNMLLVHEDSFYGLSPDDVKGQIQFPDLSFSARSDEVITPDEGAPQSSVENKQVDPKERSWNKNQVSPKELFTEAAIIQSEVNTEESSPSAYVLKEEEISTSKDHGEEKTLGKPSDFLTEDTISPSEVSSVESTPIEHTFRELDTPSSKEVSPTKYVPEDIISSLRDSSDELKPTIDVNMNMEKPILKDSMMEEQQSSEFLNEKIISPPDVKGDNVQATIDVSKIEEMFLIRDANVEEKISLKSSIADEITSTGELEARQPGATEMSSLGRNKNNESANINTIEDSVFPVESENEEETEKYEDIVNSSIELKKLSDEINEANKSVEQNKTNPTLTSLEKSSISNTVEEEDAYQRLEEPKSDELIPETREIVSESGNPELDEDMKYRTAHGTGVEITAEPIGRVHSIVVGQGQQPPKKTVNVAPQKTSFVLTTTDTNTENTDRKSQYENTIPITEDLVQEDIIEQNFAALDENEAYFYDLTSSSNKNEESNIKNEKNETNRLSLYEKLLNVNKSSNEKLNNNDTDIRNEQTGVMRHQSGGISQASMASQPPMTSQTSMTSQQPEPISPKKVPPKVARKPTKSESDDKETSPGRLKQQTSTRRPIKQLEQPEAEMTDFMKIMKKRKTHVDTMDNAGRLLGQIANRDEKIYGGKRTLSKNWRIVKQAVRKKEYLRFKDKPMPKLGQ